MGSFYRHSGVSLWLASVCGRWGSSVNVSLKENHMHKKLISLIVFPLVLAGVVQAQPAMPTVATALEAYDMPGYFMISRNTTQSVRLVQAGNETPQGLWKIVTGLAGTGTVSFMPTALENHYMRHRSYILYADPARRCPFRGRWQFHPASGFGKSPIRPSCLLSRRTSRPVSDSRGDRQHDRVPD